jgi:hypothetical protein
MKTIAHLLLILLAALVPAVAADEVTLYNAAGQAAAYVADDATIYLWDGTPAAYLDLESDLDTVSIYGYNGKHLGWFEKGVIYDADGKVVGGVKEVFTTITELPPLKGPKGLKPPKGLKELKPSKPVFTKQWSLTPLNALLLAGTSKSPDLQQSDIQQLQNHLELLKSLQNGRLLSSTQRFKMLRDLRGAKMISSIRAGEKQLSDQQIISLHQKAMEDLRLRRIEKAVKSLEKAVKSRSTE